MKIAETLSRGAQFIYNGNISLGIKVIYGDHHEVFFEPAFLQSLLHHFRQQKDVLVGAVHNNEENPNTLDGWIRANMPTQTSFASYLSAIFVLEEYAEIIKLKPALQIRFFR